MVDKIISWYSGYKGEEYPLSFLYKKTKKRTKRLIKTKLMEDSKTKKRKREFHVETENGEKYLITVGQETKIKKI